MTKRPIIKIIEKDAFRYYQGRHIIKIILQKGKKALIEHRECGFVGNKKIGYKSVGFPMRDIVLIRH